MHCVADRADEELRSKTIAVLGSRRAPPVRTTAATLRFRSGKTVTAMNLRFAGYGACAEIVAVAVAEIQPGDTLTRIICVGGDERQWHVYEPCGNCRQMLAELAPDCEVLLELDAVLVRIPVRELLPIPYWKRPNPPHSQDGR